MTDVGNVERFLSLGAVVINRNDRQIAQLCQCFLERFLHSDAEGNHDGDRAGADDNARNGEESAELPAQEVFDAHGDAVALCHAGIFTMRTPSFCLSRRRPGRTFPGGTAGGIIHRLHRYTGRRNRCRPHRRNRHREKRVSFSSCGS